MGRGYWIPENHDRLAACDGFYIDSRAAYAKGITEGWERFLDRLSKRLCFRERTFRRVCGWKAGGFGQSYFVLVENRHVEIIAEDVDGYIAVYVLIPEECPKQGMAKRSFPKYLAMLQESLTELYPGSIYKRLNSQHIKAVG